jgi:hypothetical protein
MVFSVDLVDMKLAEDFYCMVAESYYCKLVYYKLE